VSKTRRRPDWSCYPNGSYPLPVLVALSCDIEPEDIDLEKDREDPDLAVFWARLAQATEAVRSGELVPERDNSSS
jgi:hypothetical protein